MLTIISCFAWLRDVYYKKALLLLSIMKKQKKGLNYCFSISPLRIFLYDRHPKIKVFF